MSEHVEYVRQSLGEEKLDPKLKPFVEAMFLAAAADGEVAPEELAKIMGLLERFVGRPVHAEDVKVWLTGALHALHHDGRHARLARVASLLDSEKAKETALILATMICAADHHTRASETDTLFDMADAFGLEFNRAQELITNTLKNAK